MSIAAPERSVVHKETAPPPSIENAIQNALEMQRHQKSGELPIFSRFDEIKTLIQNNEVSVIEGETGSGKTTVVPLIALEIAQQNAENGMGRVIVTQPRRFPAQSLFKYMKTPMGGRVGYRHGGGAQVTKDTQLEFAVEGSLLNDIVKGDDPLMMDYDTVVVDEVHEGTVNSAILLALLKDIQKKRRHAQKPLKIIMTSATLDKDKMINYFRDSSTPDIVPGHIKVEGKPYPVEEFYENSSVDIRDVEVTAAKRAIEVLGRGATEPGDVLIFMPGEREIKRTVKAIEAYIADSGVSPGELEIISMSGSDDTTEAMEKVYEETSKRRIIVSTNMAETSVTIPTVRVVIDSGLMRQNIFDSQTGLSGLETVDSTKSNSRQRRGRAGRTQPGTAHFLFTKEQFDSRHEFLPAEILRSDLTQQVLLMKRLGIADIPNFDFIDHPGAEKINQAIKTLNLLGALNPDGSLSQIGSEMTRVDTEPRFARMLVEARSLGIEEDVALVIGMIQNARFNLVEKGSRITDSAFARFIAPESDIRTRLNAWNEYVNDGVNKMSKSDREAWALRTKINTFGFFKAAMTRAEIVKNRNIPDSPIDTSPEHMAKIYQAIATGLIDNFIEYKNGAYQTLGGVNGIQIDRYNSVISGKKPLSFLSTNLRKTENGPIIAGLNFEIKFDDLKNAIPYLERVLATEKPPVPVIEKEIEAIKEEIKQAEEIKPVSVQEEVKIQESEKPIPVLEANERKTRIRRLQEQLQSFQKKILVRNGKSPEAWEDFKKLLRRVRILRPDKTGSKGH